ncbi:MAG: leucyl/phenylalanyl-tRNA--protein transferase [Pseudomonadota bacterium]|nr:leucyl/phenylalanyl-tRNA--protein transferase [Pseudomonadota bacterium]
MTTIPWIPPSAPPSDFPPVEAALQSPNGLLAAGGDLSVGRLLYAYQKGIFPWYNPGEPILWWSPDPRAILYPHAIHVSRSLRRELKRSGATLRADSAFEHTVHACAAPREAQSGTWITEEMQAAYGRLHRRGFAHSVEVWLDQELIGGIYGVALNKIFFGESMFSRRPNASKIALVALCAQLMRWGYHFIDAQVSSPHLLRMGAVEIPRWRFLQQLEQANDGRPNPTRWQLDDDLGEATNLAQWKAN